MNPQSTDKTSESTNNLSANIIEQGTVSFTYPDDYTNTGTTIGSSPPRTAYYATKSATTIIKSGQIPFVYAWYNVGQSATSYLAMNNYGDFDNPYLAWGKAWLYLDKVTSNGNDLIRINFNILDETANITNGITVNYTIVSANATESSGL